MRFTLASVVLPAVILLSASSISNAPENGGLAKRFKTNKSKGPEGPITTYIFDNAFL